MNQPTEPPLGTALAEEFAAALEWWKHAGVEYDFADDATDWLAEPDLPEPVKKAQAAAAKRAAAPAPPPKKLIGGDAANWPRDLAVFQDWWIKSTEIDEGGGYPVIPVAGQANPALMIVVAEPEEVDKTELLSGLQGKLLSGMLRAAGVPRDQIYFASVLRRHTPMPDWPALKDAGAGKLLSHHIGLVAPKRLLTFGRNIPPLLGNDTAQGGAILHNVNHEGGSVPALGVGSLSELLRSAPRRQRFWQRWLEWTDN